MFELANKKNMKKTWSTPEITSLNIHHTQSGVTAGSSETAFMNNASSFRARYTDEEICDLFVPSEGQTVTPQDQKFKIIGGRGFQSLCS